MNEIYLLEWTYPFPNCRHINWNYCLLNSNLLVAIGLPKLQSCITRISESNEKLNLVRIFYRLLTIRISSNKVWPTQPIVYQNSASAIFKVLHWVVIFKFSNGDGVCVRDNWKIGLNDPFDFGKRGLNKSLIRYFRIQSKNKNTTKITIVSPTVIYNI